MTKFWDVGQVKTRLGASIGMERAAGLHRLFISHLCTSLADVADQRIACLSPDPSDGRFEAELRSWGLEGRWNTIPQGDGNLGDRMERWFIRCLSDQVSSNSSESSKSVKAILIGGDCPILDTNVLRNAAELLAQRDVVLGPAADGGYYLIGMRGPFGFSMPTESISAACKGRNSTAYPTMRSVPGIVGRSKPETVLFSGGPLLDE